MVTNVPQGATAWALGFGAISGSDFGVWAEGEDTQMEEISIYPHHANCDILLVSGR